MATIRLNAKLYRLTNLLLIILSFFILLPLKLLFNYNSTYFRKKSTLYVFWIWVILIFSLSLSASSSFEVISPNSSLIVLILSRRPSGLRKTRVSYNSLAHITTWLRSDLATNQPIGYFLDIDKKYKEENK